MDDVHYVFVNSIVKTLQKGVIMEASNGSPEGPPFIRINLPQEDVDECHIGKQYQIIIKEAV